MLFFPFTEQLMMPQNLSTQLNVQVVTPSKDSSHSGEMVASMEHKLLLSASENQMILPVTFYNLLDQLMNWVGIFATLKLL